MKRYYLYIIGLSMILIALINIFTTNLNVYYIIVAVVINTIAVIADDGIVALAVRYSKKKFFNPYLKIYYVSDKERHFYEKIGIKKWKDKVPEMGKYLCNFGKSTILDKNNNEYIYKFMQETCYAEVMHILWLLFGFLIIFIYPLKYAFNFGVPVACVNFLLTLLPVFIQRYNRPKLKALYEYNKKHESEREKIKSETI